MELSFRLPQQWSCHLVNKNSAVSSCLIFFTIRAARMINEAAFSSSCLPPKSLVTILVLASHTPPLTALRRGHLWSLVSSSWHRAGWLRRKATVCCAYGRSVWCVRYEASSMSASGTHPSVHWCLGVLWWWPSFSVKLTLLSCHSHLAPFFTWTSVCSLPGISWLAKLRYSTALLVAETSWRFLPGSGAFCQQRNTC